jgi:hypothetical protein
MSANNKLFVRFQDWNNDIEGGCLFNDPHTWYEHTRKVANSTKRRRGRSEPWRDIWPITLEVNKHKIVIMNEEDYLDKYASIELTKSDAKTIADCLFDGRTNCGDESFGDFTMIYDNLKDDGVNTDDNNP